MDWRRYGVEEIEAQFNPRKSVPDFDDHQARHAAWSAAARAELAGHLDVPYGDGPLHKVDVFPAPDASGAPVHVYFHGGYWRAQDKANFAHIARTLVGEGICTIIANYDLCPAVTLDEVVGSALRSIAWIWRHAREYGGDPDRLSLSGHSAGAHLCAMALVHDWTEGGLPADVVKGTVPVSGIFDPTDWLRFRGSRSRDSRAANFRELYYGQIINAGGAFRPRLPRSTSSRWST